jgi:hypothetical protein
MEDDVSVIRVDLVASVGRGLQDDPGILAKLRAGAVVLGREERDVWEVAQVSSDWDCGKWVKRFTRRSAVGR